MVVRHTEFRRKSDRPIPNILSTKERAQKSRTKMIESARALCGGLLLLLFWFSIFSVSVPALAAANSDAAATKAHTHHRHGVKPKAPPANESCGYLDVLSRGPTQAVKCLFNWVVNSAVPIVTAHVKNVVNGIFESVKAYSFFGLIGLFALLVVSAFIGAAFAIIFAIGSFVRKFYKIVERLNPATKPVVLVLDERQMKIINPQPTQPVLESPSDKIGQLVKKEPVIIDVKPRAKRRASLTSKLPKIRRKSHTDKEAA
jgi:hypothetical protein